MSLANWIELASVVVAIFVLAPPLGSYLAKVYGGGKGHVPLVADKEVKLMVPRGTREKIIARVVYSGPVPAPVQQGQKIGTLKVWRGDFLVLEVPLQAASNVGTGSLSGRAFDAATELVLGLFRAGLQRL